MKRLLITLALTTSWLTSVTSAAPVLQNDQIALRFDGTNGTVTAIDNKLSGETYPIEQDQFAIEAVEFRLDFADAKLTSLEAGRDAVTARYESPHMTVEARYWLRPQASFVEKQITLTASRAYGLKKVVLSRPSFSNAARIVPYRYPKFGRDPGGEPNSTFFGRTDKGGFFTGVEVPFDASSLDGQRVTLGYAPSLKVAAGEKLVCEPVYFGVYRRGPRDVEKKGVPFRRPGLADAARAAETAEDLPLQAESDAMVAMTSEILGPFRFGLVPMACGWHSEMTRFGYSDQAVTDDMKSLDFLAECGVDWVSDSHPWGGETEKMNALGADDRYEPGPLVRKFLEHAREVGVKVVMWSSMNNTHAWWGQGKPFRADKPEWTMKPAKDWNCIGCKPFLDWLIRINLDGMATGYYKSWAMDGDFFGGPGWYNTVVPVRCPSDKHDHLPGDSNYACQRALRELTARVRKQNPDAYIFMCRPAQDLGVWALRFVDVVFTLLETGQTGTNLVAGDVVRTWSRVRVHRDFFPHYEDQPLLFPSREGGPGKPRTWSSEHLDYIMLSGLSSSPNQLYYLPTKSGIPAEDKAEIRKWLDWGRKNIAYLKVRKDLPDWPAAGKVDGSAHIIGGRGLLFLFNSGTTPLTGEFALTEEGIGLKTKGALMVTQEYPQADRTVKAASGETVRWEVPAQTAVILRVEPTR